MKTNLTNRMMAIANMVIRGEACADIGTDHGYIPAYLLEKAICPKIILTDINEGPLSRAKENLSHIDKDKYDLRLGDGIKVLNASEVSTVIIAGMGGELIEDILGCELQKSYSFKRFVLQPRTKCDELRIWLCNHNFEITDYSLAFERGRICEIFSVSGSDKEYTENRIISDSLLRTDDPLKEEFINRKIKQRMELLSQLEKSKKDESEKILSVQKEIKYLKSI